MPSIREAALQEWIKGECKAGLCGHEAACLPGPDGTHKCVCPHDRKPPQDGRCKRKTVPIEKKTISISIIPPSGANITAGNSSIPALETDNLLPTKASIEPLGGVFAGLFIISILLIITPAAVCYWKRKTLSKYLYGPCQRKNTSNSSPSKGLLGTFVHNPQYTLPEIMPVPILERDKLKFIQDIGEGCFGKVFKGELHFHDGTKEIVAVKVLKETASKEAEEDFMREVEIMSAFKHRNILSLIGVVLKEPTGRPWMVFEFMPHGDLAEVLRSNSRQLWKPIPGLEPLTSDSLLLIAIQIAEGMKYLAAQRFVHNDLACRNCLVGDKLAVKIADFGMSRDVYTCDYYRIGGSRPVPLRWMSPESVMYRRFTLESDVWSYGVVLWEIYSLAKQPYYGLNNEEVVKLILQGIILIPPDSCPPYICDIMRSSWKSEPKDRIKFSEIVDKLNAAWNEIHSSPSVSPEHSSISLPRPPMFPITGFNFSVSIPEALDSDNYLAPQINIKDYLEPLPEPD